MLLRTARLYKPREPRTGPWYLMESPEEKSGTFSVAEGNSIQKNQY
jgi:hypothetical protein